MVARGACLMLCADHRLECVVLGHVLLGGSRAFADAKLEPNHFRTPAHLELWRFLQEQSAEGVPLELEAVTLAVLDLPDERRRKMTDPDKGPPEVWMGRLPESVVAMESLPYYAGKLRERAYRRDFEQGIRGVLERFECGESTEAVAGTLARLIQETRCGRGIDVGAVGSWSWVTPDQTWLEERPEPRA